MKVLIFSPAVFSLIFLFSTDAAKAQTLPTRFSQVLVASGISDPTVMAFAPDGRIFVAQQTGQLRIIKDGTLLAQPFISLSVNSSGERGLLGIAFDPNFNTNKYIYLYYTLASAAHNRISRFTANGDRAVAGSERIILDLDPLSDATNHNGGTMQFGPDGKLYVGVGDNAEAVYAQTFDSYHGKILRINPDGSVPPGNPFTTGSAQQQRLWSYGVRNPFTIAFQPGTGKLFVNDVGGSTWEEINDATAKGKNFGWPYFEGGGSSYSDPLYAYGHGSSIGTGCAITGGTFFNPPSTNYPTAYFGKYFFLDYCSNWIDMLTLSGGTATRSNFASNIAGSPVSLVTGTDGNLYFLSRDNSAVYKITYTSSSAPVITNHPQSLTVAQGKAATFSVSVTGGLPFSYQWRKDSADISGATSFSYTIPSVSAASAGTYSVVIRNAFGTATSKNATLAITSPNKPPVATITTPVNGTTYAGGNVISFSGTATDPENGALAANAYKWYVMFHHGTHTHPGPSGVTGATSGSFTIPTTGETATDVFYRLYLVVTDQQGAKDTAYKDIRPRTSNITLYTSPQGLNITLDGQPYKSPLTITSVEGIIRTIGTTSPQAFNGLTYKFGSWSQSGAQTQKIATPVNNTVYTAKFSSVVVISNQPKSITVIKGNIAKFSVSATGTAPLSYQWRKNGTNISGATSSSYTITAAATANAGAYSVSVSNAAGSTISSSATLTVVSPPVITKQPANSMAAQGSTVTFTVTTTGTAPFSFQWRKNGINISGATSSAYAIASVTTTHAANYSVVIKNAAGTVISNDAKLTVIPPPVITKQPQDISVSQGNTATFSAAATGTVPLKFQWRKDGTNIIGATGSSYKITSATALNEGTYSVVVSNVAGSVISNNATLTVISAPVITGQPQSITVAQENTATFTVTASGTAPLSYQWRKNGTNISGATSSAYSIPSVTTANAGTYSAIVSNAKGNVTSHNATLTVTTGDTLYTIFQPAAGPVTPINNDGQGIELGVRFRSTQNGFITGIRYYKGAGTTGTHIGHLWSNTGVLLGAATFTNETVSGWQQVLFSSPVAITAGVTYVASQFSPSGDYPSSVNYFTQAVVNGPLRGLADGEDGLNGVYNYSTSAVFPTNGNLSSNYWVDVVFTAASGTELRGITKQTQQQQQLNVNLHKNSVDRFAIKEPDVNVMPNPSNTFFNLVIKGNNKNLVTVRVFDISGQVIEKHEKIASSGTLQLGHKWISGSYFVEVIQGDQRKFIKIIKVN